MTVTPSNPGLNSLAARRGVTESGAAEETPERWKLRKAAREFEAILISQMWEQFQSGLSSLAGETQPAGSDTLNSLAIQAMSMGLARRGGLGIAQMIVRQLTPGINRG